MLLCDFVIPLRCVAPEVPYHRQSAAIRGFLSHNQPYLNLTGDNPVPARSNQSLRRRLRLITNHQRAPPMG
jgi:hypothetical protein